MTTSAEAPVNLSASERVEFLIDSGDFEVGVLRYRFLFRTGPTVPSDPESALRAAIHDYLSDQPHSESNAADSLTSVLESIDDRYLDRHGLDRLHEPLCTEIEIDDDLLLRPADSVPS